MKKYKCPFDGRKYVTKESLYEHLEYKHKKELNGLYPAQLMFNIRNHKTGGKCIVCGAPTKWNPVTEKYSRLCGKESCRKELANIAKKNMIKKYNKPHLLGDPEQQKKMLKNRKISGTYQWKNGYKHDYVGNYEKDFLLFTEFVLNWTNPEDIVMPAPISFKYYLNGEEHFYIPDVYITSVDLYVEIKGSNNHYQKRDHEMEVAKDEMMINNKDINYIKILDKSYAGFVEYLHKRINGTSKYVLKEELYRYNVNLSVLNDSEVHDIGDTDDVVNEWPLYFEESNHEYFLGQMLAFGYTDNAPTFAYRTLYGKNPTERLNGMTNAPKKKWNNLKVDACLKDKWLDRINNLPVEIRSTDCGKSSERPAFVIFRMKSGEDILATKLSDELNKLKNISSLAEKGRAGKYRVSVVGNTWEGQSDWKKWWDNVHIAILNSYNKVVKREGLSENQYDYYDNSSGENMLLTEDKHNPYKKNVANNSLYYHASPYQNIDKLKINKSKVKHTKDGKPKIYASDDMSYAAGFCFKWDGDIKYYSKKNGTWVLEIPKSAKVTLNEPASMYLVEPDSFRKASTPTPEVISFKDVNIVREIKFKTARDCLKNYGVDVIFVDNKNVKKGNIDALLEVLKHNARTKDNGLGKIYLATHNEFKINDFQKYNDGAFFVLKDIPDIDEVDSKNVIDIAKYKALDMYKIVKDQIPPKASIAIEDTSLDVNGEDVGGNIRWLINELDKFVGKKATVTICVGVCDGKYVKVYKADLKGKMISPTVNGYGFDPYVEIDGIPLSYIAKNKRLSDKYSLRKRIVAKMKKDDYVEIFDVDNIKPWTGKYQQH